MFNCFLMRLRVVELGYVIRDFLVIWSLVEEGCSLIGLLDFWSFFEKVLLCCEGGIGEVSMVGRIVGIFVFFWVES